MNYALLVYVDPEVLRDVSSEDRRALHGEKHAPESTSVIAHYRFRPARLVTTLRVHDDRIDKAGGRPAETGEDLRALYVLEGDDEDAVLDFASRLPAVRLGGTVEVWPLVTPHEEAGERGGHRAWRRRH